MSELFKGSVTAVSGTVATVDIKSGTTTLQLQIPKSVSVDAGDAVIIGSLSGTHVLLQAYKKEA